MAFKIQGASGILDKLINWVATSTERITDFNVGSATRTLLESTALQLEEFYYDLQKGIEYAIRNSAYHAFGFERKASQRATGKVTIYFDSPLLREITLVQGTQFHTGKNRARKIYFESTKTLAIPRGSNQATIPIICTIPGTVGNVNIGEISKMTVGNPNIALVTNHENLSDGKDTESLTDRTVRFREYVHTLQKATKDAVAYGIKEVPGVAGVSIDDTNYGIMYAYAHDNNGNLSDELKAAILNHAIEYRSGGIEVSVRPIVKVKADLDINVTYREGIDPRIYDTIVAELVTNYLNNLKASESLNLSNLITAINDTYRDIIAYIEVCNNEDIYIRHNEIIRAGNIKVNGKQSG